MIDTIPEARRAADGPRTFSFVEGWADLTARQVHYRNGSQCPLSKREAELLRYLAHLAGRAVSRDQILSEVWRLDPRKTVTRTVDMHIAHLRDKLRDDPAKPRVLFTLHGHGYMLLGDHGRPAQFA
jgi:DNA-binding response OmpR family regulator